MLKRIEQAFYYTPKAHLPKYLPSWRCEARSAFIVLVLLSLTAACGENGKRPQGITRIEVWAHAGQESERNTLLNQVARFNDLNDDLQVRLKMIPEGTYNAQVQAAAVAGKLPDLLEFDGPFLYAYVWQGHLRPLDELIPQNSLDDFLPSIIRQGTYHNRLWALGTFDSGLGLYANRNKLERAGIRIPTLHQPWGYIEFNHILQNLVRNDPDNQVLDLKLNYAGEWTTYALLPLILSAGGDLIDRSDYRRARGILNGPETVRVMQTLQSWIQKGWVDPNIDDAAFVSGRVALSLGGHWNYRRYHQRLAENLLLLPLPDFGHGPETGQGSWCWAITTNSRHPETAVRFLNFLLRPGEILAITQANGAVPATYSAINRSPNYNQGGPLHLFVRQLQEGFASPRPQTPAYPFITSEFQKVFDRIRSGSNVQAVLDGAAQAVDHEITDNRGYPLIGRAREEALP